MSDETPELPSRYNFKKPQSLKGYLFEFIMLFLAVTLGFFVENKRQKLVEIEQEERLAISLVNDLRVDLQRIDEIIRIRKERIRKNDSLFYLINSPKRNEFTNLIYYYGRSAPERRTLYYQSNMIEYVKTGGFQAITNIKVSDNVRIYYVLTNDLIATQVAGANFFSHDYNQIVRKILDAQVVKNFINMPSLKSTKDAPKLLTDDKLLLSEYAYTIYQLNSNFQGQINFLEKMKSHLEKLIPLIVEEYNLGTM